MLRSLVTAPSLDYDAMEERTRKERLNAEEEIFKRIARLRGGALKKPLFKTVLSFAQTYLIFRENQRFYLDHILARWRRLFLEYGHRFTDAGIIGTDDDIFFLSKEEIFALAENPHVERDTIARRRADFETWASVLPPKFLRGGTEFDDTVVRQDSALRVTGTSASPGIARGRCAWWNQSPSSQMSGRGRILVTQIPTPAGRRSLPSLRASSRRGGHSLPRRCGLT
jgi:pyruvate,water dikinase